MQMMTDLVIEHVSNFQISEDLKVHQRFQTTSHDVVGNQLYPCWFPAPFLTVETTARVAIVFSAGDPTRSTPSHVG
jgi:hypothetical protein